MELRVSSYKTRADLEAYCEQLSPEQKASAVITGMLAELTAFQLSPTTSVHGVCCEAIDVYTDRQATPKEFEKPKRRQSAKGHGLDGVLTDIK